MPSCPGVFHQIVGDHQIAGIARHVAGVPPDRPNWMPLPPLPATIWKPKTPASSCRTRRPRLVGNDACLAPAIGRDQPDRSTFLTATGELHRPLIGAGLDHHVGTGGRHLECRVDVVDRSIGRHPDLLRLARPAVERRVICAADVRLSAHPVKRPPVRRRIRKIIRFIGTGSLVAWTVEVRNRLPGIMGRLCRG